MDWLAFGAVMFALLVANAIAVYALYLCQEMQDKVDWIVRHGVFTAPIPPKVPSNEP